MNQRSRFWYKVADRAVKRHLNMHAKHAPNTQQYLAVVLHLQRKWANANGVDFDAALRESKSLS